ncbi:hypothetical protein, partial [Brunnivagina elsteri]
GYLVNSLDRVISLAKTDKFAYQLLFKNQVQRLNRILNIALTATETQLTQLYLLKKYISLNDETNYFEQDWFAQNSFPEKIISTVCQ